MGSQHAYDPEDRMFLPSQPWKISVSISRGRSLALLALAGFACATILSVASFAQSGFATAGDPPLNFAQSYLVRGDFVVAGAYNLTSTFTFINGQSYAVGTISVPDHNPGITGQNMVLPGGQVTAAVLYWQTVEKVGVMPGQPGSGQIGFFRPLIPGGPKAPGYQVTGLPLGGGNNTVSWSDGGCTSGSTGKVVRTYRANVSNALPRDASGNILANGQYEVRLPGTSSTTPIAVFGTLVLVYSMLDSSVPLNLIAFYDGDTATSASSMTMTQTIKHLYDAAHNPVSRLAYIVGGGKSKKTETVSLNGVPLPSLYTGLPPFIGFYGTGDNPVWTFGNPNVPAGPNPIQEDADAATTQVMASGANPGCQSLGAIILSTTIKNTDRDGLPDAVKIAPPGYPNPGYCDADTMCTPGDPNWVDLPGAVLGTTLNPHPDIYLQIDYMCSRPIDGLTCKTGDGVNYSFDPTLQIDPADGNNAVQKVVNMYAAHGITLHVNPPGTNQPNVHAIPEPSCTDTNGQPLCVFPHPANPPNTINLGVVAWPEQAFAFEHQLIDPDDPTNLNDCATSPPAADCIPRFQPAAALTKHHGLFAHAEGQFKWAIFNSTFTNVMQKGNTVTFTTSAPVGAIYLLGTDLNGNKVFDPSCPNGRVTIVGAATNPNLNGTHCLSAPVNPQGTTFTITVGGSPMNTSFTLSTDPNLLGIPPFTTTASGVADVMGHHFVVSLGRWGNPAFNGQNGLPTSDGQNPVVIAGTLAHEAGHALFGLAHGGGATGSLTNSNLLKSVTTNCKPNYLSVMSYSRQVDGILDYSESALGDLNKTNQTGDLFGAGPATASWYVLFPASKDANGNPIGSPARLTCPGGPLPAGEAPMARVTGPANTFSFVGAPDPNFDGNLNEDLPGACDWTCSDLGQNGATSAMASSGLSLGGGGLSLGGGGLNLGGGGLSLGGGGLSLGGGGEIDLTIAESITHAITDLTVVSEGMSPRKITLKWSKPFGDIGAYNVYRSKNGGPFTIINAANTNPPHTLVGNPPVTTFTDTVTCEPGGYRYFVTAVQSPTSPFPGDESSQGNIVSSIPPLTDKLTGCYVVSNFSSPASGVQGTGSVPITWTLTDDFYPTGGAVTRQTANTLVAIGPMPGSCTTGRTTLLADGVPKNAADMFNNGGDVFTFTWNNTDAFCAGSYTFELDLDHVQASPAQIVTTASALQLSIDVTDTDSNPHVGTTALSNGVVGTPYSNSLSEDGGTGPFTWTRTSGSLPLGITLSSAGLLTGTPTQPGTNAFTVMVTDSAGNAGTQTLTLNVVDALFGDLIVVDGSPSGSSGTVFRITPDGTVTATIANISSGTPTGVAVDPSSGNIYAAVAGGTPSIVKVTPVGATSSFVSGGVLQNPVAVAVDASGNVYVGDNHTDAIYKFNSSGAQVGPSPFASLPSSPNTLQDIRMAFDSAGNLIVASDSIGDFTGQVEVDKIDSTGVVTTLYNTTTNANLTAIGTVGGVALLADGSIDVADFAAKSIFNIANPGAPNMAITTAVNGPAISGTALCCNISGMANPPSQNNTSLYLTINGVGGPPVRVQLAVPETSSVSDVLSGAPLTFPNDVASYSFPGVTFYVDGFDNFGILNLGNGSTKVIGPPTVVLGTGIDVTPNGQVYVDDFFNHLYQMNPSTGAATLVGTGSIPAADFYTTGGLANGSYFAVDASSGNLYSINLSTGATTFVGLTGTAKLPPNCGVETTMAGSATVLYYTIGFHSGRNICNSPLPDTLYQIDPTTGATTTIGPVSVNGFGVNSFVGSGYVNGKLYAFTFDGKEYLINTVTGAATFVTNTTPAVFGAGSTATGLSF